jgi:hypothetical protein
MQAGQDDVCCPDLLAETAGELDLFRWATAKRPGRHHRVRTDDLPSILCTVAVAQHDLARKLPQELERQVRTIAD